MSTESKSSLSCATKTRRPFTIFERSIVDEMAGRGCPHDEIAARVNRSIGTIRGFLRRNGLNNPRETEARRKLLRELWGKCHGALTSREFQTLVGCCHSTIRSDLRALGLYEKFQNVLRRNKRNQIPIMIGSKRAQWRIESARSGWVGREFTGESRRILDAVRRLGEASAREVAADLGLYPGHVQIFLRRRARDGTLTDRRRVDGRFGRPMVYRVAPGAWVDPEQGMTRMFEVDPDEKNNSRPVEFRPYDLRNAFVKTGVTGHE